MTLLARMLAWYDGTGAAIVATLLFSAIALGAGWVFAGDHWPTFFTVPLVGAIAVVGGYHAARRKREG
jgi:hypothetical protein